MKNLVHINFLIMFFHIVIQFYKLINVKIKTEAKHAHSAKLYKKYTFINITYKL